jgi:hypothetical protein
MWKKGVMLVVFTAFVFFLGYTFNEQPAVTGAVVLQPSNHILVDDISLSERQVCVSLPNATIAQYEDTNSMTPTLDADTHGIEILPVEGDIEIGDIIAYRVGEKSIIHRVVDMNESGYYTQGDNNKLRDPVVVQFDQIEGVVVGLLY